MPREADEDKKSKTGCEMFTEEESSEDEGIPRTPATTQEQREFNALLEVLAGEVDDTRRRQAQDSYDAMSASSRTQQLLLTVADASQSLPVRSVAGEFLKDLVTGSFETSYLALSEDSQRQFRKDLLFTASDHRLPCNLRPPLCECIAHISRQVGPQVWPDLDKFLFFPIVGPSHKSAATQVYSLAPEFFEQRRLAYLRVARDALCADLEDECTDPEARSRSLTVLCAHIVEHRRVDGALDIFSSALPTIVRFIASVLERPGDERLLISVAEVARACPEFLRPRVGDLVDMCQRVIGHRSATTPWRHQCLDTVVAIADALPAAMRFLGAAKLSQLLGSLFQLIADSQEVTAAYSRGEWQKDLVAAEEALIHLSLSLKGYTLIPAVAKNLCAMVKSDEWKQRYAALVGLNALFCEEALPRHVGRLAPAEMLVSNCFDSVLGCLRDAELKVRYAASMALGQIAARLSSEYVCRSHERVVPDLLALITLESQPKLICVVTETLRNFLSACPQEVVATYLGAILYKLDELIKHRVPFTVSRAHHHMVTEAALETIATLAELSQSYFQNFYDASMPAVRELIYSVGYVEGERLRWLAIHCIARAGLAAGKNSYMTDAEAAVKAVLALLANRLSWSNDQLLKRALTVAHVTCRVLGAQSDLFVKHLLPAIYPILSLRDARLGGFYAATCAFLGWYALKNPSSFAPYADNAVECVLPMLSFGEPTARGAAAEALPRVMTCAASHDAERSSRYWIDVHTALTGAIEREKELSAILSEVCGLQELLALVRLQIVPPEQLESTTLALDKCFEFYFRWHCDENYDHVSWDDFGVEGRGQQDALSRAFLHEVADMVCSLLSTLKDTYFPFFDRLAPYASKLLTKQRPWTEHLEGLTIFNAALSIGSAASVRYRSYYLPELVEWLESPVQSVRALAAKGLGILADVDPSTFASDCTRAWPHIVAVITARRPIRPEESFGTEAAVVAAAAILDNCSTTLENKDVPVDELFQQFLSCFCVLHGDSWRRPLELVCALIEKEDALVKANPAGPARVLMDALKANRVVRGSALEGRIVACLRHQKQEDLPEDQRNTLREILGGAQGPDITCS